MKKDIEKNNGITIESPFLTVGIINYNYGHYLKRCLDSIIKQKYKDFELIIADNDSTDNSVEIINDFVEDNNGFPITFVRGENVGHCGNLQRILDRAKGEYILFCDADDFMLDGCLEKLTSKAQKTKAALIAGSFQRVTDDGEVLSEMHYPKGMTIWTEEATHCKLYKMSVIKEHNIVFKNTWKHPDSYFNYVYYQYNDKTEFVRDIIYCFCKHSGSSSAFKNGRPPFYNPKDFNDHMKFVSDIFVGLHDDKKEPLEYSLTRMYYFYVLYQKPGNGFTNYLKSYKEYRDIFLRYFPEYLANQATKKLNGKFYARSTVTRIIWILSNAERMHVIIIVLWLYWVVGHFIDMTRKV